MRTFELITLTPPGLVDPSIAIAASRAGGLGVLDVEYAWHERAVVDAVGRLAKYARDDFGIKLNGDAKDFLGEVTSELPDRLRVVILTSSHPEGLKEQVDALHRKELIVLLEATCLEQAESGERLGVDGLIAKGHEAGGRVGEETTFILLQRLLARVSLPVWAQGGLGLHTAAACYAAGAAGIVLDGQLALTRESLLPGRVKARIAIMDGSETVCLGGQPGETYRVYSRPGSRAVEELRQAEARLADAERPRQEILAAWRQEVLRRVGWGPPEQHIWLLGQDAAFAAPLAQRYCTVGGVLEAIRHAIDAHCRAARGLRPLDEGSTLAQSHGTRYPIVQGPMTRVSNRAEFALRVAEGGGLPFLALALMRAPEVKALLEDTRRLLGDRPWGVGILGFVPLDLRQEQIEGIRTCRPPFALIAGGRPDQARVLEQEGIATYLHVPSPGLLRMFLQNGARRFVFEGRECGGHVGPRSSFVLWDQVIDVLVESLASDPRPEDYHVVFAAGIHDAPSASMIAVMAAPLAERGARVGVLLGTAYLFTKEAVATGAIVEGFQQEAIRCTRTVLLETGPGHAIRCADTPYVEVFEQEKRRLSAEDRSPEAIYDALEELNLGRLRIASKGITRHPRYPEDPQGPKYITLGEAEQHLQGMYMIGQVGALRDRTCTIEQVHHEVSVESSERLMELAEPGLASVSAPHEGPPSDVAIIGMACLLPKAPNLLAYWENILGKVDAITEVPKDRWDWERYYDSDPGVRDKAYSKWGGFLGDVPFDPARYGIPPNALASIEAIQLLMLEAVRAALEDAGHLHRPFPRQRTSVILGAGGGIGDRGQQYCVRAGLPELLEDVPAPLLERLPEWTEDSLPGILLNVIAGRVANRFDLGGVNYVVDAACASSLAAVYLAARELEMGTSDVVIAGGVENVQNPFAYLAFSKTRALSPRGRCRAFDESADGIVISEGIAIVVLKRLADAERDGNRIYAVLKGIAGSSDGRDKSLTAPRPEGQALALERAYAKADVSPATVGLIEAHGTGTVAGDQAEVETLKRVFEAAGAARQRCAIGSVKSMIGHTKSAAGVAGLIKVALALHHRVLPPTMGVEKPNTKIRFEESPFYINTEALPWINGAADHPRRAGVSAFGFGGTNFHAVVEEYNGEFLPPRAITRHWPSELFLWSAPSRQELVTALESLEQALGQGARPELGDLAYTLYETGNGQRAKGNVRLAIIASSVDDLRQKLKRAREGLTAPAPVQIADPGGIYCTDDPLTQEGKVAFLFPGQGSQYPSMLRDLAMAFPEVVEVFERADRVLAGRFSKPLSGYMFPPPAFSPEDERAQQEALAQPTVAQPVLGAAGIALVRLLQTFGLRPDMLAGHSYGEYVALCAAGAIGEEPLLTLSEARGRCILEAAQDDPGTMAAVQMGAETIASRLASVGGVWIANLNAPEQTVISGTRAGVATAVESLQAQGISARPLRVACAFHSPLMVPAQRRLAEVLSSVTFATPSIETFSNTTAAAYPHDPQAIGVLLAEQLVRPVRFADEIEAMYSAGGRLFVEMGPHNVLTGLIRQTLGQRPHVAVAVDLPGRPGLTQLQHALGQLAAHGAPLRLEPLFQGRGVRQLDLSCLVEETAEKPLPPTTWLVNGARARPLREAAPSALQTESPTREAAVDSGEVQAPANAAVMPTTAHHRAPSTSQVSVSARIRDVSTARALTSPPFQPGEAPSMLSHEPQPSTERDQLTLQLLKMVSTRTGYSLEMLGVDLNIEADLGIDSIKRVEILGAFQRTCLPVVQRRLQESMDRLMRIKTVRGIVDLITTSLESQQADPPGEPVLGQGRDPVPQTPEDRAAEEVEVSRSLLTVIEAPLRDQSIQIETDGVLLITDDERGVAQSLVEALRRHGCRIALARMGKEVVEGGRDLYMVDFTNPVSLAELVGIVRQRQGPIRGLLHLLPLKAGMLFETMDLAAWRERLRLEVKSLFHLAKAASTDLRSASGATGGWLVAATSMGGTFTSDSSTPLSFFPGQGGVAGLIKTLAQEWPDVRCKVIDLDPEDPPAMLAGQLLREMAARDGQVELGYKGSRRFVLWPRPVPLAEERPTRPDSSWVVLITGGARGITAEVARELAARYRPTLVLVGRSPLPEPEESPQTAGLTSPHELKTALMARVRRTGEPVTATRVEAAYMRLLQDREIRSNLAAMQRAGATVSYHQADVRDERAFGNLIDEIYRLYGRVDGVIHGAGIIDDKLLEDKAHDSFDRVFDTKADSAFILSQKLRPDSLKSLTFFSSVAARFGNRGQGDYAAANEVLNKLAVYLDRRWRARVVSVNWGPWKGRGMVSPELERRLTEQGVQLIPSAEGPRILDRELQYGRKGEVEVVVAGGGPGGGKVAGERVAGTFLPVLPSASVRIKAVDHPPTPHDPSSPKDIAIVGMACLFPRAPDVKAYWEGIVSKVDAITESPKEWRADLIDDPDAMANDRTYCRRGGWLGDLSRFDPVKDAAMTRAVGGGEPDQALALRVMHEALADAGYLTRPVNRERVEVILGRSAYFNNGISAVVHHGRVIDQTLQILKQHHPEYTGEELQAIAQDLKANLSPCNAEAPPGVIPNSMPGGMANRLNLIGANSLVDAACASSLIALQLGTQSLLEGRCDMAIVGGVQAQTSRVMSLIFCQLNAVSRSGVIRPFDKDADGTLIGEGYGILVVKRREDAERDGDRIYALIKGVGVASDGQGLGLTAPREDGEVLALRRAYEMAGISRRSIGLIEAHGMGTPDDDVTEVRALRQVFGLRDSSSLPWCALGSVKSMIGHTLSAAGAAGLIKAALALHHKVLPPTSHCDEPNPRLELGETAFYINTESRPWIHGAPDQPRRAGVNAFGFGGVNAHAILEEYTGIGEEQSVSFMQHWDSEVFILEGNSRASLVEQGRRLHRFLSDATQAVPKDVAYSLNTDLGEMPYRLAVVASSLQDLQAKLDRALERLADPQRMWIKDRQGIYFFAQPLGTQGRLAFLFPGEGSQYVNMLVDLCLHFPEVRACFDKMDRVFTHHRRGYLPSDFIFPRPAFSEAERKAAESRLWQMDVAIEALLTANHALYTLLNRLGIRPGAMVGHSTGEYSAMRAAGMLDEGRYDQRLLELNRLYEGVAAGDGVPRATLLAVGADRDQVAAIAQEVGGLYVAMDNCPHQVVLAGSRKAADRALERIRRQGFLYEVLPFDRAYHTALFAPYADVLREFLAGWIVAPPQVPLYSCTTMSSYPADLARIRELALQLWVRPVEFSRTIEAMYADGVRIFVEVGPKGTLTSFVDDSLRTKPHLAVASNVPSRSGILQLNHAVALLAAHGVPMRLDYLYERRAPCKLALDRPSDPTGEGKRRAGQVRLAPRRQPPMGTSAEAAVRPRERVQGPTAPGTQQHEGGPRPFVEKVVSLTPGEAVVAECEISLDTCPFLRDHTLGRQVSRADSELTGLPVMPMTMGMEMLAEAAHLLMPDQVLIGMKEVRAYRWIALEDDRLTLKVIATRTRCGSGHEIHVQVHDAHGPLEGQTAQATPIIEGIMVFDEAYPDPPVAPAFLLREGQPSRWLPEQLYEEGMFHGPAFRGVVSMDRRGEDGAEATLEVLPSAGLFRPPEFPLLTDPVLLDQPGQVVAFWMAEQLEGGSVVFPYRLEALYLYGPPLPSRERIKAQARVALLSDWQVRSDLDVVRGDGRVWARLVGWEDRRFGLSRALFRFLLSPRDVVLSEPWPTLVASLPGPEAFQAYRLSLDAFPEGFFTDHGGIWRRVLAHLVLSRRERELWRGLRMPEPRRLEWLLGRVVAKDAVRRFLEQRHGMVVCPADIEILPDGDGRPVAQGPWTDQGRRTSILSLSHTAGVVVAIVGHGDAGAGVGVDIERMGRVNVDIEELAFTPRERQLLASIEDKEKDGWPLRLWCAKEAAAKAVGQGMVGGPQALVVQALDPHSGIVQVSLAGELASRVREADGLTLTAFTTHEGDLIVATSLYERRGMRERHEEKP